MSEYKDRIDPEKKKLHAKTVEVLKEGLEDEDPKIRLQAAKASTEFLKAFGHYALKSCRKSTTAQMDATVETVEQMDRYPFKAVGS